MPHYDDFDLCLNDLFHESKRPRCYSLKNDQPNGQCYFLETDLGIAVSTTLGVRKSRNSWDEFFGFSDKSYESKLVC